MADPIRATESITPLPRTIKDRQPSQKKEQQEAPRDKVSLSHPNNSRTLKLLLHILADSLGHKGISAAARSNAPPKDVAQVASFLLSQIDEVMVSPFLSMTPLSDSESADRFENYIQSILGRLTTGKIEARAVFRALETASPEHLDFVTSVGKLLEDALGRFVDEARLQLLTL